MQNLFFDPTPNTPYNPLTRQQTRKTFMQNIGFIGLGIMGTPMALHMLRAGRNLHFYARRPEVKADFESLGATYHHSPEEVAKHSEIIIINVATSNDVEEVIFGQNGIIHSAKPGTIVIDMGTTSANTTKRIAAQLRNKRIDMLDAPVSGGEQGAIDATLSIMVGGDAAVVKKAMPIFESLGTRIVHIGDHGAGQIAKACNQIIIAETIVAVSEALHLAAQSGVDPAKVREALLGGFANSKVLEIHGKRMLENNYKPGFKANLHRKDMHLAIEQANTVGANLPSALHAMQCIDRLVLKGHGELDSSAVHLVSED